MEIQPVSSSDYLHLGTVPPSSSYRLCRSRKCAIATMMSVAVLAAFVVLSSLGEGTMISSFKVIVSDIPHTGEWCAGSGAKIFSRTTLKRITDRAIYGLLRYDASAGESKFEASDVLRLGEYYYVVCDSSWSILKVSDSLPLLSHENVLVRHDASFEPPAKQDSGFEAIIHDQSSFTHGAGHEDFYLVRESVEQTTADGASVFDAQVMKVHISGLSYSVVETCHSEFKFEGDSKGFEGGISLRGSDGVLYILGLCEGNYCVR